MSPHHWYFIKSICKSNQQFCYFVLSLSYVWLFETTWTAVHQASLSFTISQSLLKLIVHWVGDAIQPSHPQSPPFSSCPQSFPASESFPISSPLFPKFRVFSNELALHISWPKCWSFSISPSSEYSELLSFRIDWFDLIAVQGTLKSLLQHHSWKASILWCSVFFMAQLSHPYMTTGKSIALTIWTFIGKVMSLLLIHCLVLS